jgi:hypothetical protein
MKSTVMTLVSILLPSVAFCASFAETCQKINPVSNQYVNLESLQTCSMVGMPYQYALSDLIALNSACELEATGNYANATATNSIGRESEKMSPTLMVSCWTR